MPGSTRQAEAPRSRRGLRSNTFRPPSCKKRGVGVVPGTDIVDELRTELHVLILCYRVGCKLRVINLWFRTNFWQMRRVAQDFALAEN